MHVCVVTVAFDAFKGGNHLPLFAAAADVTFTILANSTKPKNPVLPPNVRIVALEEQIGSFYYGVADGKFAEAVLRRYPPAHEFWTQFDVIHLNQTLGLTLLRLRETGKPLLSFIHHPVSADRQIALEETSGLINLHWRLKYARLWRWQREMTRNAPHVATVSHAAAHRIAADYGRHARDIEIIPNGVDGEIFRPGDLSRQEFDVIAVGALIHPRKGFHYLLEVYRALAAKGYRIADVGRRSPEQQRAVAQIQGVQSFGMVDDERLRSLVQNSAVLVSTSLYEGFGLSLIEALACGRPAFAFDAGAVREVLSPIDPRLVVPLRDVRALVSRVTDFLHLPIDERVRRGTRYRADVLRHYSMDKAAASLQSLYRSLRA